jgi:hypothetical protein
VSGSAGRNPSPQIGIHQKNAFLFASREAMT